MRIQKLGIIAGMGSLPGELIQYSLKHKQDMFVLPIKEHADPKYIPKNVPQEWIRFGQAATGLKRLKKEGVTHIVMIGGPKKRPQWEDIKPDLATAALLAKISTKFFGDDSFLSALIKEMERQGFQVIGIDDVMPEVLVQKKCYTKATPDKVALSDIERAQKIIQALSPLDVGQACVVQHGIVLGIEAIEGTNELLKRAGKLKQKVAGGILLKMKKTKQDRRVDLPTIGVETIQNAHAAGLRGIALQAGHSLLLNEMDVIKTANKLGLFVIGI